jgi:surface protein
MRSAHKRADHARAARLHAARAAETTDTKKARAHAARAVYHASFGGEHALIAQLQALPFQLRWLVLMQAGENEGVGCKAAIAVSENGHHGVEARKGLYDTHMTTAIDAARLFVPARCVLDAAQQQRFPDFTAKCARFYQNCAARSGLIVSDSRVANLDNKTIRDVMREHRAAICGETFYPPIGEWDVSRVTDMSQLFLDWTTFNQPIGKWDTSNVRSLIGIFTGATAFNQPIGEWDVSRVERMGTMFYRASAFNQPIGRWNTQAVTNMDGMFFGAVLFDQPIGRWVTNNVTHMQFMFFRAHAFNQRLEFDTRNVREMGHMFGNARAFNNGGAPLAFDTRNVREMRHMFESAHAFNNGGAPLEFDTRNVRTTEGMFMQARAFRQQARFTDMGAVENVKDMFLGCNPGARCVTLHVNHGALGYADQAERFLEAGV